jgi:hypothetical protein
VRTTPAIDIDEGHRQSTVWSTVRHVSANDRPNGQTTSSNGFELNSSVNTEISVWQNLRRVTLVLHHDEGRIDLASLDLRHSGI